MFCGILVCIHMETSVFESVQVLGILLLAGTALMGIAGSGGGGRWCWTMGKCKWRYRNLEGLSRGSSMGVLPTFLSTWTKRLTEGTDTLHLLVSGGIKMFPEVSLVSYKSRTLKLNMLFFSLLSYGLMDPSGCQCTYCRHRFYHRRTIE